MADVLSACFCFERFKYGPDELEQLHKSKEIDKTLAREKHAMRREVKLLLLGAGESGKSTFLKQMKIIHGQKFEEEDLREFSAVIYQNIVRGMKVLLDARAKLHIPWEHPSNERYVTQVLDYDNSLILDTKLFLHFSHPIEKLWQDKAIKTAFERRKEFQLGDSVRYFFENLDRISSEDYNPSHQDILHARKATKSINEFVIYINTVPFRFVDVGGQRSQRQKWFKCFESVTSILFLVSSNEFDQVLLEDRYTNRLVESQDIFDTIVNNRCFVNVSFILFLNKTDLLQEKLEKRESNIAHYFPRFMGDPHRLEDIQIFLLKMFEGVIRDKRRQIYHHFTTAVDTENIKVVFNAVRNTILQKNINQLMLQ
ncbi:guanine nucleotide-binding protein subunit alpha homolog [Limulus polyphemus]|uniref:Guanine nucleotide-binding protein subunit alpha homolog n=1 Tax=Limulus polyphemus TaxID=6850 RepID=A0ABM1BPB4_LIMPO|nr:guanine nucleotide-binding protein subunit alpha homolog [Limulus polyphemus]